MLRGEPTQGDTPNWQPLIDLIGEELVGSFMWMFEVELSNGSRIQAYKHIDTRRYIHLNSEGQAFAYRPEDSYLYVDAADVLDEVFASLPGLAGVTEAQIEASRRAAERLRGNP
jgi:hypothetical protein